MPRRGSSRSICLPRHTGEVARGGAVYSAFAGRGKLQSRRLQISDHGLQNHLWGLPPPPRMTGDPPPPPPQSAGTGGGRFMSSLSECALENQSVAHNPPQKARPRPRRDPPPPTPPP